MFRFRCVGSRASKAKGLRPEAPNKNRLDVFLSDVPFPFAGFDGLQLKVYRFCRTKQKSSDPSQSAPVRSKSAYIL